MHDSLVARGLSPLLVGGTPLYAEGLVRGYQLHGPPPDLSRRSHLEALADEDLVARLDQVFPGEAQLIGPTNRRRLIRAIERAEQGLSYTDTHQSIPFGDWVIFGVTWDLPELETRILERLRSRLHDGMVAEVETALSAGLAPDFLWTLGLEYRFILRYLDNEFASEDDFVEQLGRAIRRFAKRQLAWFRKWPDVVWLDGTEEDRARQLLDHLAAGGQLVRS